ncbi:DUF4974 domain-containing protein [Sphingobacterium phlebotomi]|uniref:DUF4974 domain-containing protein n=1 Tax=Sphingobacterium phlebotomi TaxID=2605433 RepID=A0A5D4GXG9_9SPHI|nr:FecR domain-containing protein [Sphingobacterium phlebotomi]TYR32559.1 DUF4974 domain-containing protein [Sphingobacterium phlebotomi]
MENNELYHLIRKYLQGTASTAERERLLKWYRQDADRDVFWETDDPYEEELVHNRIQSKIWVELDENVANRKTGKRLWLYTAVAAICLAVLGISFWKMNDKGEEALIATSPKEQSENRFVLLPDSSRVVLRPGSRLEYTTDFKGATREVSLVGEAYFDIYRKENQPFIIHTGKVKTVVLGTAFTIKAADGKEEVKVMVQRGKVRVEREEKVMAELTANEQIEVRTTIEIPKQEVLATVENTFDWTGEDMRFDAQAFGELTSRLERRYDVEIRFNNPDLADCPISGKFSGLETLEEVLDFLCTTRGATFHRNGKVVEIDGKGC